MISYEILRKKRPIPFPPPPTPQSEGGLFERIGKRMQQNPETPRVHPMGMGKIQYAKWLSDFVYPRFPLRSLVTLANQPFVPGVPPRVWFKVIDIQELHYSAQYDRESGQPKCVGVSLDSIAHPTTTIPVYYPPTMLRALQPEEVEAIDRLRNKESSGRDAQTSGLDGTEESADRSTGETS